MDLDLIKSLIDALEASSMTELEYERDGSRIRLAKGSGGAHQPPPAPLPDRRATSVESSAKLPPLVRAPIFGVVHLSRAPGAPPLAAPGTRVVAGQVLCLIEAMKVFTELRCEEDGLVAEVLVTTGQDVEAGQALFRLE